MSAFIYLITNSVNGKRYIGKTIKTVEQRFASHLYTAKAYSERRDERHLPSTHLYNAINKHGSQNFNVEVLEVVEDIALLNEREMFHIAEKRPEYNMTAGGDGFSFLNPMTIINNGFIQKHFKKDDVLPDGWKYGLLESTKEKMKVFAVGRETPQEVKDKISKSNKGKVNSPETIEKIRQANLGSKRTEDQKAQMGKAWIGRKHSEESIAKMKEAKANNKYIWSDEQKAKMSEERKGRKYSDEAKANMSKAQQGHAVSEETKAKIGNANRGREVSEETRAKLSENGRKLKHTEETKARISAKQKGRPFTEEHKAKIKAGRKLYNDKRAAEKLLALNKENVKETI
jgi:group I intron endonuclease